MRKDIVELVQTAIDFMEENLTSEIRLEELCSMAGYSEYHFCQLFQTVTGLSVKQYLVCRRLKHAVYEIARGRKSRRLPLHMALIPMQDSIKLFIKNMA